MLAQQTSLDTIANNLANVNTAGFKRRRAAFEDLLYTELTPQRRHAGPAGGPRLASPAIQTQFEQGALQRPASRSTSRSRATGFFEVTKPDGTKGYTRAGNFTTDAAGAAGDADGRPGARPRRPPITIPKNATDIDDRRRRQTSRANVERQAQDARPDRHRHVPEPGRPDARPATVPATSADSGRPDAASAAGGRAAATIAQGELEMSNVNAVDEMVGMITTQRAYEAVSKVVSASDEMLGTANQLRR